MGRSDVAPSGTGSPSHHTAIQPAMPRTCRADADMLARSREEKKEPGGRAGRQERRAAHLGTILRGARQASEG